MTEMVEIVCEAFFACREMLGPWRRGSDRFGRVGGRCHSIPEATLGWDCSERSRGLEEERRGTSQVRDEVVDKNIVAVEDWGIYPFRFSLRKRENRKKDEKLTTIDIASKATHFL